MTRYLATRRSTPTLVESGLDRFKRLAWLATSRLRYSAVVEVFPKPSMSLQIDDDRFSLTVIVHDVLNAFHYSLPHKRL